LGPLGGSFVHRSDHMVVLCPEKIDNVIGAQYSLDRRKAFA
jgi:hypothetical protein